MHVVQLDMRLAVVLVLVLVLLPPIISRRDVCCYHCKNEDGGDDFDFEFDDERLPMTDDVLL